MNTAANEAIDLKLGVTGAVDTGGAHPTLNTKPLFKLMVEKRASDLFFTANAPIKIKIEGQIFPVNKNVLTPEVVHAIVTGTTPVLCALDEKPNRAAAVAA